ncbi:MAG: hypothetical protein IT392_01250 [Nitrospirae bacterium]|nr:hypothetical protein [Nitrospirota bacterium]
MKKQKRLGRGLEDISHYFVSQNQTDANELSLLHEPLTQNKYKSVSIVDIADPQRGASLCAEVGAALSQNGVRVLLIDADVRFPGISFMLGLSLPGVSLEHYYQDRYEPSDLVCIGPYGVRLLAPHLSVDDIKSSSQTQKYLMLDTLKSIEAETDIIIIRQFEDYINPIIDEALFVVPADTASIINSYREIKKFMTTDDRKKAGILVSRGGEEQTAVEVYEKICRCSEISFASQPYLLGDLFAEESGGSLLETSSVKKIVSHFTQVASQNSAIEGRKILFFDRLRNLACGDGISPIEMEYLTEADNYMKEPMINEK